jgi:hypothetical protein
LDDLSSEAGVRVELRERVLTYRQEQFDAWARGDRSLTPTFVDPIVFLKNSPRRHFGEMFVLRHYSDTEGWKGFSSYALGDELSGSERRRAGRAKVEEIVPRRSLRRFRALRATGRDGRFGAGTPDLFLYDASGRFKFVEVKRTTDSLRPTQLRCIAQVMKALRCDVDIVYLREARQTYTPRTYVLDLDRCEGLPQSSSNKPLQRSGARGARPGR